MKNRIVELKKKMLHIAHKAKQAHLASAFSVTEILLSIYDYIDMASDRVILSKGHSCLALYTILNEKGDYFASHQEYYDRFQSIDDI